MRRVDARERREDTVCLEGGEYVGVEGGGEDSGVDEGRMPIVVGHVKGQVLHCRPDRSGHRLVRSDARDPSHLLLFIITRILCKTADMLGCSISDPCP